MLPTLPLILLAAATPQSPGDGGAEPRFAAPIRLTADGVPLGGDVLYPSPRLFDIDQDGAAEMVVGDLRGRVMVAEKVGDDPATWGRLAPFATDGRELKFHNW